MRSKAHIKRLLEHVEPRLYHERLKARLIRQTLSNPSTPIYWEGFEPKYAEVNIISSEMLVKSKRLAKAFHALWQRLDEKYKRKGITWKRREEERAKLEAKAWKALEELKGKYD